MDVSCTPSVPPLVQAPVTTIVSAVIVQLTTVSMNGSSSAT